MSPWVFDREGRPRTGWRIAICLVGFLILQIVVAILSMTVLFAAGEVTGSGGMETMQEAMAAGQPSALLQAVSVIPSFLATLLLVWACRKWLDRRGFASLGLGPPGLGWGKTVGLGISAPLVVLGGLIGALIATENLAVTGFSTSWQTWTFLVLLVFAAFTEELLTRGYLMQNLLESSGPAAAILVSSACFWLLHGFNPAVWSVPLAPVNLFGAGIVLGLVYLASGDLWLPTLLHYAWNATEGLLFELPVSGFEMDGLIDLDPTAGASPWLTGGDFGFEGSILATLGEVILAVIFYRLWKRRVAAEP